MSRVPPARLSHCGECERVFIYDPAKFYKHPAWPGHTICVDCAKAFGAEPVSHPALVQ